MKLTLKEAEKICNLYKLGQLKSFKLITGGLANFNYILQTNQDRFIVQILGTKFDKGKQERIKQQFRLMNFLKNKKFPYEIPIPIKSESNKEILNFNNKNIWVYKMLKGNSRKRIPNENEIKQIAKALATYHKYVKEFSVKINGYPNYLKWILELIRDIKQKTNPNEIDKLALKEKEFFEKIILKEMKRNYSKNILILHSDFDASNVLFNKNKLIGIIDFDDAEAGPKIRDIAISLRDACTIKNKLDKKRVKIFIEEYKKINNLSQEEEKLIPNIILAENAGFFAWAYSHMKKEKENRYKYMKEMSLLSHKIIKKIN